MRRMRQKEENQKKQLRWEDTRCCGDKRPGGKLLLVSERFGLERGGDQFTPALQTALVSA